MKNTNQLRDELADIFAKLKAGEIKPIDAAELANIAGKMISSAKAQIDYYNLRKEVPVIGFLEESQK